jgi:hypothetical protein
MGLLEPGAAVVLTIDPPLQDHEQPILFTPHAGDVLMHDVQLGRLTVVNHANRISAYVLTIVPKVLVKAAMVPWGRVLTDLKQAVRDSGVLDQIGQLFGAGAPAIPGK